MVADRTRRVGVPVGGLIACLAALAALCLPYLPNQAGRLGVDWGYWFPNLLAGTFWHIASPAWAMPWFTPSECAGVPLHADPQGAYLSLTQLLAFAAGPLLAVQISLFVYAGCGFLGAYALARGGFACSRAASLLGAGLFALNSMFSARMLVGHLSFAPFMLLPAMAACLLGPDGVRARRLALRCLAFGALLAICVEAGMAVLLPPAFLSLAILVVLHALCRGTKLLPPAMRAAAGTAFGLALCAGKLAAMLSLMAHLPRDAYPMPGFSNIAVSFWMALRSVFAWPAASATDALVNSALRFEPHEFDYGVGPVPLVLLLAGVWLAWRGRDGGAGPRAARTRLLWETLLVLLLIPLALNTYAPGWTAFLKHVPVLRSASSMLRWFAAYMLPACIGAAVVLDRLMAARPRGVWAAALAGLVVTAAFLFAGDRSFYGAAGVGVYDPAQVMAGWQVATQTRQVPAIRALAIPRGADGTPDMSIARGNLLTRGESPLFCYDPLFGYRLEAFTQGTLHPGPVGDVRVAGGRRELNLKNPACYVFPAQNGCAPGDTFLEGQAGAAAAFAQYRPFAFAKPWWARLADWLGIVALLGGAAAALPLALRPGRAA